MSQIDLLISAVYRRRSVWDHNSHDHHNHFVLNRLWNEIAEELKISRLEARKKWKNLRDRYRVELRKYSNPHPEDGVKMENEIDVFDVEKPSWCYFDALQFLKDQFTSRGNKGVGGERNTIGIEPPVESSSNSDPDPSAVVPEQAMSDGNSQATSTEVSTDGEVPDKNKNPRHRLGKRSHEEANDSNSDLLFFESLLPHIAKLSDQQKMLLMMEIQQCVYKYVYGSTPSLSSGTFLDVMGPGESSDVKFQRTLE